MRQYAPAPRAISAIDFRSMMAPVVKKTWLVAMASVRSSTASSNCCGSTRTPSGLSSTTISTPGRTFHWYSSVGKSSSVVTIRLRFVHSRLSEMTARHAEVEGMSAMVPAGAAKRSATRRRSSASSPHQCSYHAEAPMSCQRSRKSCRRSSARVERAPSEQEFR